MYKETRVTQSKKNTIEHVLSDHHVVVHPRMAWMIYYEQTKSIRKVCQKFGISRKTFYKWLARYQESGYNLESLQDESRRPHRSPNATPPNVVAQILKAKEKTGYGQRRLKTYLEKYLNIALSEHTIWKLLKRHYNEDEESDNGFEPNGKHTEQPGDIIQISCMDIASYISRRSEGLSEGVLSDLTEDGYPNHKPWVQYTAIDVATRLRITKIFEKHSSQSAADFLKYIIEKFPFSIREIQTPDHREFTNGSPTLGAASLLFEPFSVILNRHNIKQTVLHREEMSETLAAQSESLDRQEFYEKNRYKTSQVLRSEVEKFIVFYNNHRACDTLKGLTPLQKLRSFPEFKHIPYFDPFA